MGAWVFELPYRDKADARYLILSSHHSSQLSVNTQVGVSLYKSIEIARGSSDKHVPNPLTPALKIILTTLLYHVLKAGA